MDIGSLFRGHILWRGLVVLTSFITTIVLSRYLEAAMSGWFFYVLAWLSFMVLVASMGMDSAITYFISSGKTDRSSVFAAITVWVLLCLVVSFIIEWILQPGVRNVTQGTFTLFITGQLLILFFSAFYYGEKKFILPSFVQVVGNLFFSVYSVFYFETMSRSASESLSSVLFVYALFVLLQGIYLLFHFLFSHIKEIRYLIPDRDRLKMLLSYSGLALLANLIFFLYQRADYWLIRYAGIEDAELGNYIQASRIAQMFQLLPAIFAGALFPILSSLREKKEHLLLPLMRITLQLNMIFLFILALTGHYLFPFVFGPSFQGMYKSFLFLIPGILSLTLLSLISSFFASENKLLINLKAAVIGMVLLITGDLLLLQKHGLIAAPLVSSISALAATLFSVFALRRYPGINWRAILLPVKADYNLIKRVFSKHTDQLIQ